MRRLLPALLLAAATVFPMAANATCSQSGFITRVTMWDDGVTGPSHVIYLKNNALSSVYWLCTTRDDNFAETATTAQGGTRVAMNGTAASCPTSGTGRSMGACRWIVVNP